ncbi:MAG: serine hydrolase [Saprospiraceae bacterium]
MKRIVYLVLLLAGISHFAFGQTLNSKLSTLLQMKLDSIRSAYNLKGISASIIYPGQGVWQGTSGISFANVPIQPGMEFGIGSNTKLFTAVALLQLAEKNLVNIDDSLHRWLPDFENVDRNISIRQLLNHTSGLADYNDIAGYPDSILRNPNRVFSTTELIRWVGKPLFQKGSSWSYSNTNYLLAGMIAEGAGGKNIAKLIREGILDPLQLDSTFFDVQEKVLVPTANPWQMGANIGNIPRTSLNSAAYAAGAMYSNSSEMAQWYNKLLGGKLLHPNSIKEMCTFVGSGNYGFGISKIVANGKTCYSHGGSIRGYSSFMLYDTLSKAVICVLINLNPAPARLVAEKLHQVLTSSTLSESQISKNLPVISIYPNPVHTTLFIRLQNDDLIQYQITNSQGQKVISGDTRGEALDVSLLEKGMYFIHVSDSNGFVINDKFTKE